MSVELIDHMGDDLAIVNAAKVSFHKQATEMGPAEIGILRSLIRNRHTSPTEMVEFKFRVRVPIGVAREWFRHRIGEFNEESTRYVEMRPDFYVPEGEAVRSQVGKAMQYTFVPAEPKLAASVTEDMHYEYHCQYQVYQDLMKRGIAKEVARNVLPLGLLTEFVWKANLHSLFNFLSLRTHPSALLEIRREAEEVERLITPFVPVTMELWRQQQRRMTKAMELLEEFELENGEVV